jgi:hypothetical protein
VGKKHKLYIVHNARYWHFPSNKGRGNAYSFGKREVANRLYFVKKHMELSKINCYLAILFRILISLSYAFKERKIFYLERIRGNIRALMYDFFGI